VVGRTRCGSASSSSNTARASPHQVVSPAFVQWYVPAGPPTAPARPAGGQIGRPGRRAALVVHDVEGVALAFQAAIVLTKLPPPAPYTQAVRTTQDASAAARARPTRRPAWSARTPTSDRSNRPRRRADRVAGEDVVGRHVDEPSPRTVQGSGQHGRPRGVDPVGRRPRRTRRHRRPCTRRVDHHVRGELVDDAGDGGRVGDVELGAGERPTSWPPSAATNIGPELAPGAVTSQRVTGRARRSGPRRPASAAATTPRSRCTSGSCRPARRACP